MLNAGDNKMNIAISGASGFIGTYLSGYFTANGYNIFPLTRKILSDESELKKILSQSDVVINLAGAPINHRWTKSYKKELKDSRIISTHKIVNTINDMLEKPKLLISASAVGYYSLEGCYNEYNSIKGNSFLADLCEKWEEEAKQVSSEVRLVITRFGVVLAAEGGAFKEMMLPAKLGIATVLGSGNQPFSWIDIADLGNAMDFIIKNRVIDGTVNFVAPEKITNRKLMKIAAKHYRSFFSIRIPEFVFRFIWGESAEFITQGQCIEPKKLLDSGFIFKTSNISDFYSGLPK